MRDAKRITGEGLDVSQDSMSGLESFSLLATRLRLPTGKVTFDEQHFVGVTSTISHRDLRDRDCVWVNGFTVIVPLADLQGPERRTDRSQ